MILFRGSVNNSKGFRKSIGNNGEEVYGRGTYFSTSIETALSYVNKEDDFYVSNPDKLAKDKTSTEHINIENGGALKKVSIDDNDIFDFQSVNFEDFIYNISQKLKENIQKRKEKIRPIKGEQYLNDKQSEFGDYLILVGRAFTKTNNDIQNDYNFGKSLFSSFLNRANYSIEGNSLLKPMDKAFVKNLIRDELDLISGDKDVYKMQISNKEIFEEFVVVKEKGREKIINNQEKYLGKSYSYKEKVIDIQKNKIKIIKEETKKEDKIKDFSDKISTMAKEQPLEAKSILNKALVGALEVTNVKNGKEAYWGGTLTPQKTASLEHRLRVGHFVSEYDGIEGDSKPGERPNCRCTVYFK